MFYMQGATQSASLLIEHPNNGSRFLYLRLRLNRTAFSQLCSEMLAQEDSETDQHDPVLRALFSSVLSKCAAACVKAAIDLVSDEADQQTHRLRVWSS